MEWLFVGGLLILVFALAKKAPQSGGDPNAESGETLQADNTIIASGQTDALSPATFGGQPMTTRANRLRNRMQYTLAQPDQKLLAINNPNHRRRRAEAGNGSEWLTAAPSNIRDSPVVTCNMQSDAAMATDSSGTGTKL